MTSLNDAIKAQDKAQNEAQKNQNKADNLKSPKKQTGIKKKTLFYIILALVIVLHKVSIHLHKANKKPESVLYRVIKNIDIDEVNRTNPDNQIKHLDSIKLNDDENILTSKYTITTNLVGREYKKYFTDTMMNEHEEAACKGFKNFPQLKSINYVYTNKIDGSVATIGVGSNCRVSQRKFLYTTKGTPTKIVN